MSCGVTLQGVPLQSISPSKDLWKTGRPLMSDSGEQRVAPLCQGPLSPGLCPSPQPFLGTPGRECPLGEGSCHSSLGFRDVVPGDQMVGAWVPGTPRSEKKWVG